MYVFLFFDFKYNNYIHNVSRWTQLDIGNCTHLSQSLGIFPRSDICFRHTPLVLTHTDFFFILEKLTWKITIEKKNLKNTYYKLNPLPRCIFDSPGQSVDQIHMTPHSIWHSLILILSINTLCTIRIYRRHATWRYLYKYLQWDRTSVFAASSLMDISEFHIPHLYRPCTIHNQPLMEAYRHLCTLERRFHFLNKTISFAEEQNQDFTTNFSFKRCDIFYTD